MFSESYRLCLRVTQVAYLTGERATERDNGRISTRRGHSALQWELAAGGYKTDRKRIC